MKLLFSLLLIMTVPVYAQDLLEHFKKNSIAWEKDLERGSGLSVRKSVENFLDCETANINPYDYNAMHVAVGVLDIAAKACVIDGAWEDAVVFLKKASQNSIDNMSNADHTLSRLLGQHNKKLKEWRDNIVQQEKRIQSLENTERLTVEQKKIIEQVQLSLDEHSRAIAHSERSVKDIDILLTTLKKEKEAQSTSLACWQAFLDKERADIAKAGTVTNYVVARLKQIKSDANMLSSERISCCRRLLRLDPSNTECRRFIGNITGNTLVSHVPTATVLTKKGYFRKTIGKK